MRITLAILSLLFFSGSAIGTDADEAEAILRLIAARRQHPQPKEVASTPTGYHWERSPIDGWLYQIPDGKTAIWSKPVSPFQVGVGMQATLAPTVVGASSSLIATTGMGRTITNVFGMGRFGVTNCPPSG